MSSSFLKPSVTPATALATRLRARPWNFFSVASSRASDATSAPLSCANTMPGGSGWRSFPLGPWTSTASGATFTVTPFGIGMGFLPIRDMAAVVPRSLPDVAEHFAADAGLLGRAPGHHAARGGEDVRAQAAKHLRHVVHAQIHPAARAADALETAD